MLSSLKLAGLELLSGSAFALHQAEGLEAPGFRISEYEKPGEDGGVVSSSFYGPRPIVLSGTVKGEGSYGAHETNRQALEAACAVARTSSGFPQLKLLEITTLAGQSYFCYVEVKRLRNDVGRGTNSPYMIALVAPDHRLYMAGQQTTGVISLPTGGGFILPVILPFISSPTSGGSASPANAGNILTMPKLTLRGQLTNPYMLNGATGLSMQVNRVISGGETVVIDMAEKTIMLNSSTSILVNKANDSRWWGLMPGTNPINFSSGSASDTGTLEITWYSARLGL